ncbi:MAG: hypothetical protein JW866_02420 [Ignavibacteriales bacterium]|nr:hypothetical protein [Ignavibacteriales bacterium]
MGRIYKILNKLIKIFTILLGISILIAIVMLLVTPKSSDESIIKPSTSTNIDDYSFILNKWKNYPELIQIFPKNIPQKATDVKMSYQSAFMQGGGHFQLKVNLPENEFEKEINKYIGKEIVSVSGDKINIHSKYFDGYPFTVFYSGDSTYNFPEDFHILLLDINPSKPDTIDFGETTGIYWNHGESCGFAFSMKSNTVVYWAESW